MAATKEVTVIIMDVGQKTSEMTSKNGPTFFELEKNCVQKILMRKLFSRPKDEVSLLLMGTDGTDNELNITLQNGYENISSGFPMGLPTWNMLKYIENSIEIAKQTVTADWLDAIVVAMDYLRSLSPVKSKLKIILMTTFSTEICEESVDQVIEGLKAMDIELIVISSAIEYTINENEEKLIFSQSTQKTHARKKSEKLISDIIEETNGVLCNFETAIQQLIYYEKMHKRRMAWNCDLEIGTIMQIKAALYIYVREEKEIGPWKVRGPNGAKCQTVTEFFHNNEKVDPDDLVENILKGYMYGQKPVPYDESEGITTSYGGKSLKCIGFVNEADVKDEYLCGTGIWAVVAQKDSPVADKMIATLAKVLRELKMGMIIRYIYQAKTKPKMMVIFPNNLHSPESPTLVMQELIYKDNFVQMPLPTFITKKSEPTREQYEAIDRLMDSMDLMTAGTLEAEGGDQETGGEAFRKLLNPVLQHTYRTIAHRALHPKDPVLSVDQDLMALLNVPPKLRAQSKPHVEQVKQLFKLEVIEKTSKQALFKKMQQISLLANSGVDATADNNAIADDRNLVEIGTVSPDQDFAELLQRGESFANLVVQIQNIISNLVFKSVVIPEEKVLRAIMIYREEAKLLGPFRYNEWIEEFKLSLLQRRKLEAWNKLIVSEKFGLITAEESEMSTVSEEEAENFYRNNAGNSGGNTTGAMEQDADDVDDLFDAM